jgi:hypothetical protein
MRRVALVLAVACASCLAAPGRLSADQQTRDAVDEFSRWRDSRKPSIQQDVGQQTEDLRQQFEDIEQHFAEMGQQLESLDQDAGQRTVDLGQQLEDVRQLVLASTPKPAVQVSRVSLSEEDVGQVPETPSSTPRPSTSPPANRANPVQMQRASSSPRTPAAHQIVQETSAVESIDLLAGQQLEKVVHTPESNKVTRKPTVRDDQISVSNEDLDAGQQLEQLSVSEEQLRVQLQSSPAPVVQQELTGQVSVSGEVSRTTCIGGIVIGSVCYQSWDSDEEQGVRATTGRPQPSTRKPVQTTTTQRTPTTTASGRTHPPRLTAPVARAMSSARSTTTTTSRPEITTTEQAPARLSVSEEQIDDQTVVQVVQQRPQHIRQKPRVVGQVDNSSEEGGQVYEQPSRRTEDLGQRPEDYGQRPVPARHLPQQMRQKPKVVGQVDNSSEEGEQINVQPDNLGQRPVAVQQVPTTTPHQNQQVRQKPKVVGQVDNSSEEGGQVLVQPDNLGERPQAVQQPPGHFVRSSEESRQIIYKPDFPEQRPERVTQVDGSSEEVGQVYQRPEVYTQQQRVTQSRPLPSTTVRPAIPRRVGQLQDPDTEGSEELGRIASYIRDKVNEDQAEDYDAGQQTVQTEWQNLRQLAQQVDVRAGQQTGHSSGVKG